MEISPRLRNRLSSLARYSTVFWTPLCFILTGAFMLKYGILSKGPIATAMILFFAVALWSIPLMGLIIVSFYLGPPSKHSLQ